VALVHPLRPWFTFDAAAVLTGARSARGHVRPRAVPTLRNRLPCDPERPRTES
jgi:hypothetical protein